MNFEVRLLQQATKNQQKSMKNRMFFGTSILDGFRQGFGMIFGRKNARNSHKHAFRENLKNIDFPEGKLIFSRFRRLKISKVWATMA